MNPKRGQIFLYAIFQCSLNKKSGNTPEILSLPAPTASSPCLSQSKLPDASLLHLRLNIEDSKKLSRLMKVGWTSRMTNFEGSLMVASDLLISSPMHMQSFSLRHSMVFIYEIVQTPILSLNSFLDCSTFSKSILACSSSSYSSSFLFKIAFFRARSFSRFQRPAFRTAL